MSMTQDDLNIERVRELLVGTPDEKSDKLTKSHNFMTAIKDLIDVCGDDPERQGLEETPYRVLKAFLEYTEGYRENPKEHLEKTFDVEHNDIIMVKDIDINSTCEHHFAPIYGVAHVGYIPDGKITGLSKIARMVDGYARRFQVQERMTNQIADAMVEVLGPEGVIVVIEATHMCMSARGAKKKDSLTVSTASRGVFSDNPERKKEFMSLLKG